MWVRSVVLVVSLICGLVCCDRFVRSAPHEDATSAAFTDLCRPEFEADRDGFRRRYGDSAVTAMENLAVLASQIHRL
jgi:hypothetical protein